MSLGPSEVRVVAAPLDRTPGEQAALRATLAPDELRRAARLAPGWRERWIAGRAILRALLGEELGVEPARVALAAEPCGRPALTAGELRFSCSRSGAVALYALARRRAVGVDVERLRPLDGEVVRRIAGAGAAEAAAPVHALGWWTRAEAYLKARGMGLGGIGRLDLSPSFEHPARVRAVDGVPAPGVWAVQDVAGIPGCAAAVAAEGMGWQLTRSEPPDVARSPPTDAASRRPARTGPALERAQVGMLMDAGIPPMGSAGNEPATSRV